MRRDNPRLTTRREGGHTPARVVLTRTLDLPEDANLWDTALAPTIVMTQRGARRDFQDRLRRKGVEVIEFDFLGEGFTPPAPTSDAHRNQPNSAISFCAAGSWPPRLPCESRLRARRCCSRRRAFESVHLDACTVGAPHLRFLNACSEDLGPPRARRSEDHRRVPARPRLPPPVLGVRWQTQASCRAATPVEPGPAHAARRAPATGGSQPRFPSRSLVFRRLGISGS